MTTFGRHHLTAITLAAAVGLGGCGPLREKNTACRIATTAASAVVGAVGGGVGVAQIEKGPDNGEIAGGAAAGLVAGTIVGALLGYAICPEEAPAAPPPPAPVPRKIATLTGPQFDFDKATLRPDGQATVRAAADALRGSSERVLVTGYTDSVGGDAYNLRLSDRRAETVRDALVAGGVAASRISTKGMGEANPVASNDTASGRARNRRVDIEAQ